MSKEQDNKAIVGRWFTEFWGNPWNPKIVDELAAPDILLQYSLHAPRRGREDVKNFMIDFREAFPDLEFGGAADLIAEGDYVVGQWKGGGTHTGPAFSDFLIGSLPAASGRKMRFTGNDRASHRERQGQGRDRPGRRRDRAAAARHPEGRLVQQRRQGRRFMASDPSRLATGYCRSNPAVAPLCRRTANRSSCPSACVRAL